MTLAQLQAASLRIAEWAEGSLAERGACASAWANYQKVCGDSKAEYRLARERGDTSHAPYVKLDKAQNAALNEYERTRKSVAVLIKKNGAWDLRANNVSPGERRQILAELERGAA